MAASIAWRSVGDRSGGRVRRGAPPRQEELDAESRCMQRQFAILGRESAGSGVYQPATAARAIVDLQRTAGNAAVTGLFRGRNRRRSPRGEVGQDPDQAASVQRACCSSCATGGPCEDESNEAEEGTRVDDAQVQRYVSCHPARMSLKECPPREAGEKDRARNGPMVFLPQLTVPGVGATGVLIANFDINSSAVKPNLRSTIYWQQFLTKVENEQSTWSIVGFSDCSGKSAVNTPLREARARSILAAMPAPLRPRITSAAGASLDECLTPNDTSADRTLNRSAALLLEGTTHEMPEEKVEGTVKKPSDPSFDDCEPGDRDLLMRWDAIGTMMAGKALAGLQKYRTDDAADNGDPLVASLLVDSFGFQGGGPHLAAVILAFTRIAAKFGTSDYQYECEDDCDGDHAYVYDVWSDIHMCMDALRSKSDLYSAGVAVHEMSHYVTGTDDLEYFYYGSPTTTSLHPDDAIGNADGYQAFATEYYKRG